MHRRDCESGANSKQELYIRCHMYPWFDDQIHFAFVGKTNLKLYISEIYESRAFFIYLIPL